jgi:hypothetical protein
MNASAPSPKEGGGSNGEFIVHTKHTCDMCFQRPIIGQRFKSDVNPNFDLCARCVQAYSGPDIGLTEEVLSASDYDSIALFVLCPRPHGQVS